MKWHEWRWLQQFTSWVPLLETLNVSRVEYCPYFLRNESDMNQFVINAIIFQMTLSPEFGNFSVVLLRFVSRHVLVMISRRRRRSQRLRVDCRPITGCVDRRFALAILGVTTTATTTPLFAFGSVAVMSLYVFTQVVGPHEPFVTYGTRETLLSRMCP